MTRHSVLPRPQCLGKSTGQTPTTNAIRCCPARVRSTARAQRVTAQTHCTISCRSRRRQRLPPPCRWPLDWRRWRCRFGTHSRPGRWLSLSSVRKRGSCKCRRWTRRCDRWGRWRWSAKLFDLLDIRRWRPALGACSSILAKPPS
jgi:hypothetical protein